MQHPQITAVVLAGGLARRMGGIDKGLVLFKGESLISQVVKSIEPQVDEILINANRSPVEYSSLGYRIIPDLIEGYVGPLAGLHSGLRSSTHPLVISVPCDSPNLPDNLVSRLLEALNLHHAEVAVAKTGDQVHPVFCLCKKNLLSHLSDFLAHGGRKFESWYQSLAHIEVAFDDMPLAFANINTLEELKSLEQ